MSSYRSTKKRAVYWSRSRETPQLDEIEKGHYGGYQTVQTGLTPKDRRPGPGRILTREEIAKLYPGVAILPNS